MPAEALSDKSSRNKREKQTDISRTTLNTHSKIQGLVRMGYGNSRNTHGMVKTGKDTHHEIKQQQCAKGPGERYQNK